VAEIVGSDDSAPAEPSEALVTREVSSALVVATPDVSSEAEVSAVVGATTAPAEDAAVPVAPDGKIPDAVLEAASSDEAGDSSVFPRAVVVPLVVPAVPGKDDSTIEALLLVSVESEVADSVGFVDTIPLGPIKIPSVVSVFDAVEDSLEIRESSWLVGVTTVVGIAPVDPTPSVGDTTIVLEITTVVTGSELVLAESEDDSLLELLLPLLSEELEDDGMNDPEVSPSKGFSVVKSVVGSVNELVSNSLHVDVCRFDVNDVKGAVPGDGASARGGKTWSFVVVKFVNWRLTCLGK